MQDHSPPTLVEWPRTSRARSDEPVSILVVGTHRSGASALSAILNKLGASAPGELVAPDGDHPQGQSESLAIAAFHGRVLSQLDSRWDDPLPLGASWERSALGQSLADELFDLVAKEFAAEPVFVVRDPRLSQLLPLWSDVLKRLNRRSVFVLAGRHPLEIAGSLQERHDLSRAQALVLWLKHVLESETSTRGSPRSVVLYDDLLKDWRRVVGKIGKDLDLVWPRDLLRVEDEIDRFLRPDLRHHRHSGEPFDTHDPLHALASKAWDALRQLAQDGCDAQAMATLDRIGQVFVEGAALFGPVIASAHKRLESVRRDLLAKTAEQQSELQARGRLAEEQAQALAELRAKADEDHAELLARDCVIEQQGRALCELQAKLAQDQVELLNQGGVIEQRDQVIALLRAGLDEHHAEVLTRGRAVEAREQALAELQTRLADAQAELLLRGRVIEERDQILARSEARIAERDERLAVLGEEVKRLQARTEALKAELEDARVANALEASAAAEQLQARLKAYEAEIENARVAGAREASAAAEQLQARIKAYEAEIENARVAGALEASSTAQQLQSRIDALEAELEDARTANALETSAATEQLQARIQAHEAQLDEARSASQRQARFAAEQIEQLKREVALEIERLAQAAARDAERLAQAAARDAERLTREHEQELARLNEEAAQARREAQASSLQAQATIAGLRDDKARLDTALRSVRRDALSEAAAAAAARAAGRRAREQAQADMEQARSEWRRSASEMMTRFANLQWRAETAFRQVQADVQAAERAREDSFRQQLDLANARLQAAAAELRTFETSQSWTLTAPLRTLGQVLRGELSPVRALRPFVGGLRRLLPMSKTRRKRLRARTERTVAVRLDTLFGPAPFAQPESSFSAIRLPDLAVEITPAPPPPAVAPAASSFPLPGYVAAMSELAGATDQGLDATVSVIIPTYNAGAEFFWLLKKLKAQKGLARVEIVVIDSGSSDGTAELAQAQGCVVLHIDNRDFSHSHTRNMGADHASGDLLLFTVQDAYPIGDYWLHAMARALLHPRNEHERLAAVSCTEFPRSDSELLYEALIDTHYRFLQCHDRDRVGRMQGEDSLSIRVQGQLSDIACMTPRDIFMQYRYQGGYAEDLLFGIRLIRDGHAAGLLSSVRVIHSHNRSRGYHVRRVFVDVLFLSEVFPDTAFPKACSAIGTAAGGYALQPIVDAWDPAAFQGPQQAFDALLGELAAFQPPEGAGALDGDGFGFAPLGRWIADQARARDQGSALGDDELGDCEQVRNIFASRLDNLKRYVVGVVCGMDERISGQLKDAASKSLAMSVGANLAYICLNAAADGDNEAVAGQLTSMLLEGV